MTSVSLKDLISDEQCFAYVRNRRWPEGVQCPHCGSTHVIKKGFDERQTARQRYQCQTCERRFDNLTDTVFAGRHQTLKVWLLCLYLMGLNLSNRQIAQELMLNLGDTQAMTAQLRQGILEKKAPS